ncbi:MAG: BatD family protein [Nitrospinales bacterium]
MQSLRLPTASVIVRVALMIVLLFQIQTGRAEESDPPSPISIDAGVDKTDLTVGDVVTFSVTVRADPDIQPSTPDFSGQFKGFDLIDNGAEAPKKVDGQIEFTYWYRLRADLPGTYTISPVPLTFAAPDPQNSGEMVQGQTLTPEVRLEIKSILHLQGEPTDIRDIKSILEIREGWMTPLVVGLLLLAAAGAAARFLRRKKPPAQAPEQSIALPPHELALRELQTLKAKKWMEKGYFHEHYFALSEIFRRYLGNRFLFPALDWTSEEINRKLRELPDIDADLRQQVQTILEHTDRVKFAKHIPRLGDAAQIMDFILSFVHSTRPVEEVQTPQARA